MSLSRRRLFAAIAVSLWSAAVATPVEAQQSADVVSQPPPRPRFEGIPESPSDRREREFWQPGYWKWNGQNYEWTEGRYVARPREGAIWVPGHWERRDGGWAFIDGRWS